MEQQKLFIHVDGTNPNHHLWLNNGTWWAHFTAYPTPLTKERVRCSLRTKSMEEARARRDEILKRLEADAGGTGNTSMRISSLQEAA